MQRVKITISPGCLCRCIGTDLGLFCLDVTGALAITASVLKSLLSPINVTYNKFANYNIKTLIIQPLIAYCTYFISQTSK